MYYSIPSIIDRTLLTYGLTRCLSSKESACQLRKCRRHGWVQSLGQEDPLGKEMATHSSILAWKTPWAEKPGGLQYIGSQRVRHDWVTQQYSYIPQTTTRKSLTIHKISCPISDLPIYFLLSITAKLYRNKSCVLHNFYKYVTIPSWHYYVNFQGQMKWKIFIK